MKKTSLRLVASLVANGLRLSEVEQMDEAEMLAWFVCMGEAKGGRWNWSLMDWDAPKE